MEDIILNTGPLSGFSGLNFYFAKDLNKLRDAYLKGGTPTFWFDMRNVRYETVSIATLCAFLSISKKVREFIGYPIPVLLNWDPKLQSYLSDIEFFLLSSRLNLFKWQEEYIGGYKYRQINPNTKLLFFNINDFNLDKSQNFDTLKLEIKKEIFEELDKKLEQVFYDFDYSTFSIILNTTLELVANSILHGEDSVFVGIQRGKTKSTVSVCDGGIGFPKSLKNNPIFHNCQLSHIQGILIGSLLQKSEHGLRLAIDEVLNMKNFEKFNNDSNEGWVVISSYDAEVRWQKKNWYKAKLAFEKFNNFNFKPNQILGRSENKFVSYSEVEENGFWREYKDFLIGTRVTFEIPY